MIPIHLTIQGLYSYQEAQSIDFTKLTSANLFGIFGTVGSGKSSILEAITFALYGKTDRLNLSGDNRNYNMMNLKSNELLIDFIFETGKNQTAYRAMVKSRRNNKKFDDVKTLERKTYQQIDKEWIPVEPNVLEKAIGLSYENFKRTIIIPQGQFQEFLQLGNKDRTTMMKELFNLEKFELFYKVTALESKNNAKKQHLEGQLQQLGSPAPEQVQLLTAQMESLKAEIELQNQQLNLLQEQDSSWKKILEQAQKLAGLKEQLEKLKGEEFKFNELETKLKQYEQCHIRFRSLIDALDVSQKKITQKKQLIEKELAEAEQVDINITLQEKQFESTKAAYGQREQLRQKAEELERIIRIQKLSRQLNLDNERLKKGNDILRQTKQKIENENVTKAALEQSIKTEKAKLPDLSMLSKVKTWHIENRNYIQQLNETQKLVERFQNEIENAKQEFNLLLKQPIFEGITPMVDIPMAIQYLKEKVEFNRKKIAETEAEADHWRVQLKLESYAGELHDGVACPLCGSLNHPAIFSATSVAESLTSLAQAKLALEKKITSINDISIQLNSLLGNQKNITAQWVEQQEKIKIIKTKIEHHNNHFAWPGYEQESAVANAFDLAQNIQNSLEKLESALSLSIKGLDKCQKEKERFQVEIDSIKTAITANSSAVDTLSEQLKLLKLNDYRLVEEDRIENEIQLLKQQYIEIEKQFNTQQALLTDLRKTKDTLSGSLQSNRCELAQEEEHNTNILLQISQQLNATGYTDIAEVARILSQSFDLERDKQLLSEYRQKLALLQHQTGQLQLEMGDDSYNVETHQAVIGQIEQMKNLLNEKNQQLGQTTELLKKLQKDMELLAVLHKDLEQLEFRAEQIKTLKSLFKGSGFVNYISSVYLQNLCNMANDRFFQMTRQNLSLEITDDNSFLVRDFMNGGKVRSVKTLSGGQTFQAALSLALALADNIQKITESNQNFFFLDEGFGSLDKESLSVVFDTLKLLRRENRIVGVISHVEEMQQEIDTHLSIKNDAEKGSKIRFSWEY